MFIYFFQSAECGHRTLKKRSAFDLYYTQYDVLICPKICMYICKQKLFNAKQIAMTSFQKMKYKRKNILRKWQLQQYNIFFFEVQSIFCLKWQGKNSLKKSYLKKKNFPPKKGAVQCFQMCRFYAKCRRLA